MGEMTTRAHASQTWSRHLVKSADKRKHDGLVAQRIVRCAAEVARLGHMPHVVHPFACPLHVLHAHLHPAPSHAPCLTQVRLTCSVLHAMHDVLGLTQ
jgi:hypothetical protein